MFPADVVAKHMTDDSLFHFRFVKGIISIYHFQVVEIYFFCALLVLRYMNHSTEFSQGFVNVVHN